MNKIWRRRMFVLACAAGCIFVVILVARWQGLAYARRQLESQLGELSGGRARVGSVEVGWRQVTAHDIRLLDGTSGEPWLRIEQLVLDVTLGELISGDTVPRQVVIQRGNLTLRFDRQGKLLTQLPPFHSAEPLPCELIVLRDASITLEQPDVAPLQAIRIDGRIQAAGASIEAAATIGDMLGSAWQVAASSGDGQHLKLSTAALRLTGQDLARLPGIPPAIAKIEQVSAAVTIGLELAQTGDGIQDPRVEVTLASLHADAPAAGVRVDNGSARFVFENQALHLNRLEFDYAGGSVSLAGVMSLTTKVGKLNGDVERIMLGELPAAWNVPPRLAGEMMGEAALQFELSDGDVMLAGTASGTISSAEVAGLALEPIEFDVKLDRRPLGVMPSGIVNVGVGVTRADVRDLLTTFDPTASQFAETTRGEVTGTLRLTVPLQALQDPSKYHGTGRLSSAQISAGELTLRDAETEVLIDQGTLSLNQVKCQVAGGSVRGQMTAQLDTGALHANLKLDALSIGEFAGLTTAPVGETKGNVSGEIVLGGSWRKLTSLEVWTATGQLASSQITFQDDAVGDTMAVFQLERGVLQFQNLRAVWMDSEVAGTALVDLRLPHAFTTHLSVTELALGKVAQRFPEASELQEVLGTAGITAKLSGTLRPLEWQAEGGATLGALALEPWKIDRGDLRWRADEEHLQVTQFDVEAYGGTVKGTARIPFAADSLEAAGVFADIRCDSLPTLPDPNFKVSGLARGNFSVTGSKTSKLVAAQVELSGPTLSAHAVSVTELAGTASYKGGGLKLQLKGIALEGVVSVEGSGQIAADRADQRWEGQLRAEGIALSALAPLAGNRSWRQLQGEARADIAFTIAGPALKPEGHGTLSVERLRWKGTDVASSAAGTITLSGDAVAVQNISARLSRGTARGEMMIPLTGARSGSFRMYLARVSSRQLLAFWPALKEAADVELDLQVDGRLDQHWHGSSQLRMSRGEVAGISFQRLQVPIRWIFAPGSNRLQVEANDAVLHVGGGRIATDLKVTLGRGLDIKCAGKLQSVDLRTLLQNVPGASRGIDGALTADFSFEGRNVRSMNDLTGIYDAKLVQSRAMLLPVLQDLATAIGVGSLTRRFDASEARGRLAKGGLIRVEEMHLANSDVQMQIDGRAWLNGRIDLGVTAHTGEFEATTLLGQLLRSPLRFVQPVGIGLLIQANDFFSRRLLFFNVSGTIRNPVVRPRATDFLSQEVILFFLDQASAQLLP